MCNHGPHLKLCTCSTTPLGRNHWRLTRGGSVEFKEVVGEFLPPMMDNDSTSFDVEGYVIERVIFEVNNAPVFDFDYDPCDGDVLEINIESFPTEERISIKLVFSNGAFQIPQSGAFHINDGKNVASGELKYVPKPKY